jgi:hypothetical protein
MNEEQHEQPRERVDVELAEQVGAECVSQMRKALGAPCAMGRRAGSV